VTNVTEKPPPDPEEPDEPPSSTPGGKSRLKYSGEVIVEHHPAPPPGPADLKIHPRRPLPPVPQAPDPPTKNDQKDD
jgi:hypothetical protein